MKKKPSIGVIISAVALMLYSVFITHAILCGLSQSDTVFKLSSNVRYFRAAVELLLQLILLIGAVGLLFLRGWARKLTAYAAFTDVLWGLGWGIYLAPLFGSWAERMQPDSALPAIHFTVGFFIAGALIPAGIICAIAIFLTRPKVKEQFQ